jgi:hypothetical protein
VAPAKSFGKPFFSSAASAISVSRQEPLEKRATKTNRDTKGAIFKGDDSMLSWKAELMKVGKLLHPFIVKKLQISQPNFLSPFNK